MSGSAQNFVTSCGHWWAHGRPKKRSSTWLVWGALRESRNANLSARVQCPYRFFRGAPAEAQQSFELGCRERNAQPQHVGYALRRAICVR